MPPRRRKTRKPRTQFSKKDKMIIARYQGQEGLFGIVCKGCGRSFPMDIMQVDHIVPVSRGGKDNPSNLRLLCPTCNRRKGTKRPAPRKKSPFDLF